MLLFSSTNTIYNLRRQASTSHAIGQSMPSQQTQLPAKVLSLLFEPFHQFTDTLIWKLPQHVFAKFNIERISFNLVFAFRQPALLASMRWKAMAKPRVATLSVYWYVSLGFSHILALHFHHIHLALVGIEIRGPYGAKTLYQNLHLKT